MIGEILGHRYKLVSLLGRGGMGAVYEGICQESGRRVAVKVLHDHLAHGEAAHRFWREAEAARRIRSDHIVQIAEAGTCAVTGKLYLVTELLEGKDLQHWIDRIGPLSIRGALRLTAQALRGLRDAHASRVVHRDIKPGNLFLAQNENGSLKLKILDFGIAKVYRDPFSSVSSVSSDVAKSMTTTGSLLGSPLYMSPEQVQDSRRIDHRTDIWSLGSVLYAALSGRAPFQHISAIGPLLVAISVQKVKSIVEVAPWVPAEVAAIVHRALEINPDARYPSAEAMLADIEKLVAEGEILEEDLLSSGEGFRAAFLSSVPPAVDFPRHVVGSGDANAPRGDEATLAAPNPEAFSQTEFQPRPVERSAVPKLGNQVAGRHVTIDPRRLLGERSELWTLSLDVHRDLSTLISRIWKSLRRAGAKLPPMSYGTEWVLFEPRTQKIVTLPGPEVGKVSLDEAGIRSGGILWIVVPEGKEGSS